jgi:hypothetical protein
MRLCFAIDDVVFESCEVKKAKKQKQSKGKPIEKGFVDVLKDQGCHIWVNQRTDGAQDET